SEVHQVKIDAQSEVLKSLAEKKALNMWEIKEQKQLFYSTVHKAINTLQKEGSVEPVKTQKSEKGVKTTLFSLTFQGFVRYLASQPELWHPKEIAPLRDAELLNKKQEKKKEEFLKLLVTTEAYGELLDYAIFKEIRWLTERYGPYLLHDVVDVARLVEVSGAFDLIERYRGQLNQAEREKKKIMGNPEFRRKVKTSILENGKTVKASYYDPVEEVEQKIRSTERCLEILLRKQTEWWRRMFAVRLAERILISPAEGDMHNEALYSLFKQVADKIRELEVEPIENMAQVFKTGDTKEVQRPLLGDLKERLIDGSVDSIA
ncbi:MAG: hypothetical protein ACM3UN_00390, partial [Bacillota bacterium]